MTADTNTSHVTTQLHQTLLGRALQGNALFSGMSGLTLLIGAERLSSAFGVNPWVLAAVGAGLLLYAFGLLAWSRSARWLRRGGLLALIGDIGWVIGASALIWLTSALTPGGELALGSATILVAGFAAVQAVGLAQLRHGG